MSYLGRFVRNTNPRKGNLGGPCLVTGINDDGSLELTTLDGHVYTREVSDVESATPGESPTEKLRWMIHLLKSQILASDAQVEVAHLTTVVVDTDILSDLNVYFGDLADELCDSLSLAVVK